MSQLGIEDMSGHLLPWLNPGLKDGRGGRELSSRTNYILGTDSCLFLNVATQDARHNTDHYLVMGCLREAAPAVHSRYLSKRTRFPIRHPATPDRIDRKFDELRGGAFLGHFGGNATIRHGFIWIPVVSSTPGLRRSNKRTNTAPRSSEDDQGGDIGEQAQTSSRSGVRGGVPPCI